MTLKEYNGFRWRGIAQKYRISVKRAKREYPAEKDIPEWAKKTKVSDCR